MNRLLLSLSIVGALALAACTPTVSNKPASTAGVQGTGVPAATADASTSIRVLDFKLDPNALSVTGSTIAIAVTNDGPTVHNVTIRDGSGAVLIGTRDLREGESETVTTAIAPGTYVLFCSLPGHESLGVKGTLTVVAP